jgi:hypothetical protein
MPGSLLSSETFAFNDGTAGHTCTYAAGAPAVGDTDVLNINSDTTIDVPPAGFTEASSFVNSQGSYQYYRIAAGGESDNVSINTSGNFDTQLTWLRFSGLTGLDIAKHAQVDGVPGTSTPAIDTDPLQGTNETVVAFAALHGTGAGTAVTPVWSTGYTEAAGTSIGQVQSFVGYRTDSTNDETPQVSWTNAVSDRYILVSVFLAEAATNVTLGQASETDTANALTTLETLTLGQASETDTARTLTVAEALALARASETDTARAISVGEGITLGQAGEVDTATGLITMETLILGQAFEIDTARFLHIEGSATGGCFTFGDASLDWLFADPTLDWVFGDPILCPQGGCS